MGSEDVVGEIELLEVAFSRHALGWFKKIQQALAEEGVLEKFMPNDASDMRKVFAGLFSFEGEENMQKNNPSRII